MFAHLPTGNSLTGQSTQDKSMPEQITARILRESGIPNLLDLLGSDLEPTDLQSLLLEVYRQRASHESPSRVLERYEQNPFTRPARIDPIALMKLELLAFSHAAPNFEPVELSPLAPLGSCSTLAPVDQNKVVTTTRNTEVVSDSTNVLALECALRRKALRKHTEGSQQHVSLCASHRLVRAQRYTGPNLRAHFSMFTLCTAGRATALNEFESSVLTEHVTFYLTLMTDALEQGYKCANMRVAFTPLAGEVAQARLEQEVMAPLAKQFPEASLELDLEHEVRDYYKWVRFRLFATDTSGEEQMIGDGGFTDWAARLLSDRRERLLTSGIATERIITLFKVG